MLFLLFMLVAQLLVSGLNLFTRANLTGTGDFWTQVLGLWVVIFFCVRFFSTLMYLYTMKKLSIIKTMGIYTALDILITVGIGFWWLKEPVDLRDMISIILVLIALYLLGYKQKSQHV